MCYTVVSVLCCAVWCRPNTAEADEELEAFFARLAAEAQEGELCNHGTLLHKSVIF